MRRLLLWLTALTGVAVMISTAAARQRASSPAALHDDAIVAWISIAALC
jgi:hypothetical protein